MAVSAAALLALVSLTLLLVLGEWRSHAERLTDDRDAASTELEQLQLELEAEVESMAGELAAAELAAERAQEAAAVAEEEAQEAADREVEERIGEANADLDEARQEIAAAREALDEREALLTQAEEVQARSTFGDGVHVVGQDIEPGIYRREESGRCYWARLSGLGGEFADIIANDNTEGAATVEIHASDVAFESSRCGQWTRR